MRLTTAQRTALGKIARGYHCEVGALVSIAVDELIAAHAQPPRREKRARPAARTVAPKPKAGRLYAEKPCARCSKAFTPTGPRSKYCGCTAAAPAAESEVVWNGTMGRNGRSLTAH